MPGPYPNFINPTYSIAFTSPSAEAVITTSTLRLVVVTLCNITTVATAVQYTLRQTDNSYLLNLERILPGETKQFVFLEVVGLKGYCPTTSTGLSVNIKGYL